MSDAFSISIDISRARDALGRIPAAVERAVEVKLWRGAEEVAIEAKELAPKLYSNLVNSIRAQHIGALHYEVVTGVHYARGVEEGTGPVAGKARYYPNPESLLQFLRMTPSMRGFSWARLNSAKRGGQDLELWFRSRAMAMAIYNKGTKPHPFMKPAADNKRSRVIELVNQGVDEGLREAFA